MMFEILEITIHDNEIDAPHRKIRISQVFSGNSQVEKFRDDLLHYFRSRGLLSAEVFFTIKEKLHEF